MGELGPFLGRSTSNGSGSSSGLQIASGARREAKKCEEFVALPRVPGKAITGHRQQHEAEHRTMIGWVSKKPFIGDKEVSVIAPILDLRLVRLG